MMLASIESLMGSAFFGLMLGLGGYLMGHIVPVSKIASLLGKKD